jgi:hypothetical protein
MHLSIIKAHYHIGKSVGLNHMSSTSPSLMKICWTKIIFFHQNNNEWGLVLIFLFYYALKTSLEHGDQNHVGCGMNILKVHKGIFEIFMKKKVDEEGFQSPRRLGIKPYFSLFGISTSQ